MLLIAHMKGDSSIPIWKEVKPNNDLGQWHQISPHLLFIWISPQSGVWFPHSPGRKEGRN